MVFRALNSPASYLRSFVTDHEKLYGLDLGAVHTGPLFGSSSCVPSPSPVPAPPKLAMEDWRPAPRSKQEDCVYTKGRKQYRVQHGQFW